MTFESPANADVSEIALIDGQTKIFSDFSSGKPCSIAVHPGPGATVYISLSVSLPSRIKATPSTARLTSCSVGNLGSAPYGTPAGIVTSPVGFKSLSPLTGLRFVCIGGTAVVEVVQ